VKEKRRGKAILDSVGEWCMAGKKGHEALGCRDGLLGGNRSTVVNRSRLTRLRTRLSSVRFCWDKKRAEATRAIDSNIRDRRLIFLLRGFIPLKKTAKWEKQLVRLPGVAQDLIPVRNPDTDTYRICLYFGL